MPTIENTSKSNIQTGLHHNPGENSIVIQIGDPSTFPPEPNFKFKYKYYFEFLDAEDNDSICEDFKITQTQANQLVDILNKALDEECNVIVHCHAGICRSGAVVEVAEMMGFEVIPNLRIPNLRVKSMMLRALGWHYSD